MAKFWTKIGEQLSMFRDIVLRKLPNTPYHKKAWEKYEDYLVQRAKWSMVSHCMYFIVFSAMGSMNY